MTEFKRKLIEVALPLEAINKESAREKSIRHGHPSTLHIWWARQPLAACRAVLFASLVDDPSAHPDQFPSESSQEAERKRLFALIEELVKWENSSDDRVLQLARAELIRSCDGNLPAVLDPFCGGGSIPLEAQRLGFEAHASDLNPVAVLITKALVEIPPKFAGQAPVNSEARSDSLGAWHGARGLAADVRHYGRWLRDEAFRRIGHLYPNVRVPGDQGGGQAPVIAWLWARSVKCPNPGCGAMMPLISSFDLSTKPGREKWIQPEIDRVQGRIRWTVGTGKDAKPQPVKLGQGARFNCIVCSNPATPDYIHDEFEKGRASNELIAVVGDGSGRRIYCPPSEDQLAAAEMARPLRDELSRAGALPTQPCRGTFGGNAQGRRYGFMTFSDYFTDRQLVALATFTDLVQEARLLAYRDAVAAGMPDDGIRATNGGLGADAYADAIALYTAFAISRVVDRGSTLCSWDSSPKMEALRNTFARQALQMTWDFAESNFFSESSGNLLGAFDWVAKVVERLPAGPPGFASQRDATRLTPSGGRVLISTDPPYYDNISYADLADFFYVWLRRSLAEVFPEVFTTLLTPKSEELVANRYRLKGKDEANQHFESGLADAFARMRELHSHDYPMSVFYAFKQAEDDTGDGHTASTGWETMLEALLGAGFSIGGTWPVRSALGNRMVASGSNALASSIVLVCRPRLESAALATRKDFLTALTAELPGALRRLQQGNIAPVDLAQAAIGPGISVFSRFSKVVEADGSAMRIRSALGIINQVLDQTLAEQEGDFDADTRWAVAWFEQFGMNDGDFGTAETLSKAKNSAVNALVDAGIVAARAGKVHLRPREDLLADWDPAADGRLTVWEVTQYLIRALESGGESAAAELVRRVGGLSETARELAYRLYNICERKRWAKDALSYNALVVAWPAILRLAAEPSREAVQMSLGG